LSSDQICTSKGCVLAASHLLMAMNASADPCDNFYEYACGQWNRDHPIPDDMFAYGTFAYVRENVRQQMRVLLESDSSTTSKSIDMARIAYRTCMNTSELESLKSTQLLSALESLGGWPLIELGLWNNETFDLTSLLAAARRNYGNEIFFQVYVYADAKNTTKNTLYIDQGMLSLGRGSRDYYLNKTMFTNHLEAYKKYQREVAKLLMEDANKSRDDADLEADLLAMIEFEKEFATIIVPEDDRRNNTRMYNKRRIADLAMLMPQVDWVRFFHIVTPNDLHKLIDNDTEVIICEIEFLRKAARLLDSTDDRIKTNYIMWRIVHSWVKVLDMRFDDIKQDFFRVMTGQQAKSPRWKECAQGPTTMLPLAAGALYIREHFDSTDKKEALEMIANLREAFKELVADNDWMDSATKKVAIEKAEGMINHIGYPDFIKNDTDLDKHYERLDLRSTDSYFDLLRKVLLWSQEKEFLRLTKVFDKYEFEVSPAVVNAFYSPEKNALTFPAGILKPPFFSGMYPKMVNYGAIGAVIGHEITHGFDDQGSQFDKDGNLQNWWNPDSYKGFAKRKECIINQYSSYKVPNTDLTVNGKLTQGENIADNGGVKEAYRAYRKYVKQLGREEPRLPGLQHFSNDQIFFLSYAHFWCGHKKDAAAVQQVLTDEHSPEIFRVIGVLSNLDEFSKAFRCASETGDRRNAA
uniref:Peptidase family M13 n=2 Tax=Parascaris univalens TaxID=6257 RepID=A0A915CCL5_PARUN